METPLKTLTLNTICLLVCSYHCEYKYKYTYLVNKFVNLCDLAMSVMTNEEVLSNIYKALIQIYYTIGLYSLAVKYCLLLEEIGLDNPKELVLVYFYTSFITAHIKLIDKAFYYNKKYYDTFSKNIKLYSEYDKLLNNLIYLNLNVIISLISNDLEKKNKKNNYKKIKFISIVNAIALLIVYIYFISQSYKKYKHKNTKKRTLLFISTILVLIAGIINLYVELKYKTDEDDEGIEI